jgi:hypothetical protein
MFRGLYGGAPEASFHLELEYGPPDEPGAPPSPPARASASGAAYTPHPPPPGPRLDIDWSQSDEEAAVTGRLARAAAALVAAHASERVSVTLSAAPPPDPAPSSAGGAVVLASEFQEPPAPRLELRLSYTRTAPVLRALTFKRTSGSGAASESLVTALLRQLDTSTARRLKLCEGLGWAAAAWGVEPRRWGALRGLSLSGCGLASLPPVVGDLPRIKVGTHASFYLSNAARGLQIGV